MTVDESISNTALTPTNAQTNSRMFWPLIKPCMYSVCPKSRMSADMKKSVFKNAAAKPVTKHAATRFSLLTLRKM